ncbi:carcinoembryonic antigen-related cell adhesion molecule 5-like isoform X2 [Hoplias malabaricus]|uniref:carcinoembryonic antigen-related cell adhesion molecule 5-like isoform X2 n=1 Tax=Hoplias malabaricus TaxID=27720 RepID=UPI0034629A40
MEFTFFCCFVSILTIYTTGVSSVTLVPSENPVVAGRNVTISVNPGMTISAGTWLFGSNMIVFWFPDMLVHGDNYKNRISFNSTSAQLTLWSVQVNDSGLYVLQGANPNIRTEVSLSVQEPVSNVSLIESKTNLVEFNDSVSFTCLALGSPLVFSWINGSALVNASTAGANVQLSNNGSVLTINNITRYDRGPFTCVVKNDISNGSIQSALLNISYGPSNLTMNILPEKVGYISGSNITLSCSASSSPPAVFQWSYNGVLLNRTGQILQFVNASQNMTGNYTCTAHNTVTLRYTAVPRNIQIIDPVSAAKVVRVGKVPIYNMSFTLRCEITGPVDSVYWMKDGILVYSDSHISFSNQNKTITFSQLTLSDNGNYQCLAGNIVSNITSKVYRLAVNYGPWNVTISGPTIAQNGSSITLNCSASSQPPSNYSWYYNGSKIASGALFQTGILSFNSSGEYTCTAHNNVTGNNGSATRNVSVIVGISSIVVTPSMSVPLAHKRLQLFCNVTGDYSSISWIKNNQTFSPFPTANLSADNTTVNFWSLHVFDDGSYQCVATNIVGKHASQPYKLTANYGPEDLKITSMNDIVLTCKANSQPPSVYHWIFNKDIAAGEGPTITVPLMTPVGSNYTCVAKNPLTNFTLSETYTILAYNAASSLQATGQATIFSVIILSVLTLWM